MGRLVYIGKGNWLEGIPKRDLSAAEVKALGGERALINTGLYAKPGKKSGAGPSEDKMERPDTEDKSESKPADDEAEEG